jgi:hypothetical protein
MHQAERATALAAVGVEPKQEAKPGRVKEIESSQIDHQLERG